jgi:arylformamidase
MTTLTDTNAAFLEREYNPRVQIPEFASYFSRWKASASEARLAGKGHLDLSYGPSSAENLDFFQAEGSSRPTLIFLHGGYWRALHKNDFSWVAPPYVAAGISVAVVNYGLAPATSLMEIVKQVRQACVWLHRNAHALEIDPERMVCSGHSAGGHLTAMMLATDWPGTAMGLPRRLLSAAIAISGLFDLEPLTHAEFLRDDLRLDPPLTRALSPALLPWQNDVPLIRAVGSEESGEFHRQSQLIGTAWPEACRCPLIEVPGRHHLSVCDAFADPASMLFRATSDLLLR